MLLFVILLAFIVNVDGFDNGAPDSACSDLIPSGHGGTKQMSTSQYTISFSPSTFRAQGSPVSVTLSGGSFKGFLLTTQYDNNSNQSLKAGTFTAASGSGTKLICTNQGITHTNGNSKSTITLQWTPPTTSQGHVRFRATFVQSRYVYWVDVNKVLNDSALGTSPTTIASAATTPSQTTSTTVASVTKTATTVSPISSGSIVKDTACGKTKGCYSVCSGSTCGFLMTWEAVPGDASRVLITMKGNVGSDTSRYIAFGLSTDSRMDSDSVNYCINQPNGAFTAWNRAGSKSNTLLTDNKSGISNITIASLNGILTCKFQRLKTVASDANGQRFALNNKYTIFWATGPGSSSGISEHNMEPVISPQAAALTDFTADIRVGPTSVASTTSCCLSFSIFLYSLYIFKDSFCVLIDIFFNSVFRT